MTVVWTQRALDHLIAIRPYVEQDKPDAGRRLAKQIILAADQFTLHPYKGHPGRKAGTREWIVPKTPYIIPYHVREETFFILAVLHGAQRA